MMKGKVLDPQGKPVPDAQITIASADPGDSRKYNTTTDKRGEFVQIGLRSGAYTVTATKDKVGSQTLKANVRQGNAGAANLEFNLSPTSALSAADATKLKTLQASMQAGMDAANAGDHATAAAKFSEAIAAVPDCKDCHVNLGYAYEKQKKYPEAEAAFKKAIELDANMAEAYSGLASIYNAQKRYEEATAMGAKAMALAPAAGGGGGAEAAYNQGVILWNGGKYAEAKEQFEAAVKANPQMADAYYQLGMANLNLGQIPAAVEAFEGYLKVAPDGPKAAEVKAAVGALKK
jgi:tetratricopeptide (TPR) repeat protein